jgi:hypothetical protein
MAGRQTKYAHVVGKLPKLTVDDPDRRQLLDTVKSGILAPLSDDEAPPLTDHVFDALAQEMNADIMMMLYHVKRLCAGKRYGSEFAHAYATLRGIDDMLSEWKSSCNLLLDAYTELMVEQFEVEGVASVRFQDGGGVSTYEEPYAKVVDREKFRQWCLKHGLERSLSLGWQATNAIVKKLLLEGEGEPDGIEVFSKTMIRLNKA